MKIGDIIALSRSATHTMTKCNQESIDLIEGLGVKGDAHMGKKVKHRSRVAKNPDQRNLRQVHLIHSELHRELLTKGFDVKFGEMGENITTRGINLLGLPENTVLSIGETAKIKITGLRNPCHQLDGIQKGLMKAVLDRGIDGELIRKAGVMGVVISSGEIFIGDQIQIKLPIKPFVKLQKV